MPNRGMVSLRVDLVGKYYCGTFWSDLGHRMRRVGEEESPAMQTSGGIFLYWSSILVNDLQLDHRCKHVLPCKPLRSLTGMIDFPVDVRPFRITSTLFLTPAVFENILNWWIAFLWELFWMGLLVDWWYVFVLLCVYSISQYKPCTTSVGLVRAISCPGFECETPFWWSGNYRPLVTVLPVKEIPSLTILPRILAWKWGQRLIAVK